MTTTAIEFRKVSKTYGACRANDDLSFKVTAGSIHGFIGENGAGKSTAMKMLFGLETPDSGEIFVFGQHIRFSSATDGIQAGIAMVHQHFMLAENLTALENFLLIQNSSRPWSLRNYSAELAEAQKFAQSYNFEIPWMKPVHELSVGEQQRLEILKALSQRGKILILDEPTAVLTPQETEELFKRLTELKKQGHTLILITHKLKEVLEITDEITILRQGKVVASMKTSEATPSLLAEKMIGHSLDQESESSLPRSTSKNEALRLNLQNIKAVKNNVQLHIPALKLHHGEIIGIAGVEGNGQKELTELLLNPKSFSSIEGELEILGTSMKNHSTAQIRELSLGVFPEDRLRLGSISSMNLVQNFLLGYQKKFSAAGKLLSWASLKLKTMEGIEKFSVSPSDPMNTFSSLSGGNQQKLVAARELYFKPDLIFAFHPTRGVDIGAAHFIHQQLLAAKARGAGVLVISSELDELLKLSDRILVLYRGQIQAQFSREQFDENQIGAAMGGIELSS